MSAVQQDAAAQPELAVTDRLAEQPKLDIAELRKTPRRDLVIRFLAGAVTSVVSGVTTIAFGPRVGGVLLAFPAILAASLTLIEQQEDGVEAREDARGAIAGGCAMAMFALVAELTLGHVAGGLALVIAAAAWIAVAFGLYFALWWRRAPHEDEDPRRRTTT
jgi:hypothetical protein